MSDRMSEDALAWAEREVLGDEDGNGVLPVARVVAIEMSDENVEAVELVFAEARRARTREAELEREVERLRGRNRDLLHLIEEVHDSAREGDLAWILEATSENLREAYAAKPPPDCGCGMGDACERYDAPSGD